MEGKNSYSHYYVEALLPKSRTASGKCLNDDSNKCVAGNLIHMFKCANGPRGGDRFQFVAKKQPAGMLLEGTVAGTVGYLVANMCAGGKWCVSTASGTSKLAPCASNGTEFSRQPAGP